MASYSSSKQFEWQAVRAASCSSGKLFEQQAIQAANLKCILEQPIRMAIRAAIQAAVIFLTSVTWLVRKNTGTEQECTVDGV